MLNPIVHLAVDLSFRDRAAALPTANLTGTIEPIEPFFERMQRFTIVRRREVRLARLERADRDVQTAWRSNRRDVPDAVSSLSAAIELLSDHAVRLRPLITPELDHVFELASDPAHPLRTMLQEAALALGFSTEEANWLFSELQTIGFRPVALVCADGFEDLQALLSSVSAGEGGILLGGFVRFTGDADTDSRLERVVIRLREKGITATMFLALVIVLVAHAVALQQKGEHEARQ